MRTSWGPFWNHSGLFGYRFGPLSDEFGTTSDVLQKFEDRFGTGLGPVWDHFGTISVCFGAFLGRFSTVIGCFGDNLGLF